jgi:hypothetical protein
MRNGQRMVVRNGHLPEGELVSGAGPIPVRQPRVRHRDKRRFSGAILLKVYAAGSQRRCSASSPLPQRGLDRRFPGSVDRDFG